MTKDQKAIAKLAANADPVGLDPVLKRQLETELHAGYAFNAKTAKWFRPFVWVPAALTIGAGLAAIGAAIGSPVVLVDQGFNGDWWNWAGAALGLAVLCTFFRLIWKGMAQAQSTSETLADQYNASMNVSPKG